MAVECAIDPRGNENSIIIGVGAYGDLKQRSQ